MKSRFPPGCEAAPAPALVAWRDARGARWQLNDAARQWAQTQNPPFDDWANIAQQVLDGSTGGDAAPACLRWRNVVVEGGTLAWLLPSQSAQGAWAQFEMAVRLVGISLWRRDLHNGRMHINEEGNAMLGRPRNAEMTDQELWDAIHPDDRAAVIRADQQALAGHEMADAEIRCRAIDGSLHTVLTRRAVERDAQGHAIALVGVGLDITDQARERARVLEMAHSIELIVDATGVGLWRVDEDAGPVWNRQMRRLYGLPDDMAASNAVPQSVKRIHPDDREKVTAAYEALVAGRITSTEMEYRIVHPADGERWVVARGRSMPLGARRAVLGVLIDVTERRRGEDMRRDKLAAEAANRNKSEFLSRISHELRTPLNAVLGFAQVMLEEGGEPLADKQREHLRHIHEAGRHLLALIDDVLDIASIDLQRLPLATEQVKLAPLVLETLQWLAPAAQRAKVMLSHGPLDGTVLGDAHRLRQVVANLLSNAVKYNRPGGRVDVAVLDDNADRRWLMLRVCDSGRGMTPKQLHRLFEPFNRLGAERDGIQGTGIGLAVVRALIDAMGGRIEVDSRPGEGTEFRIWLPRAEAAASAAAAPPHDAQRAALDVLYIEDNAMNAALLQALVALRPNVRLHLAPDGRSGIAMAQRLRPAVALIDLQLPDIDGYEVRSALGADPALAHTVCIAVSANAMPQEAARARRSGFDDFWTKPIDAARVLERLDALAGHASAQP